MSLIGALNGSEAGGEIPEAVPEVETTEATITEEQKLAWLIENSDAFFLIVNGILIFFMQGGFAFLEAGAVRSKNTVNILIKNMLDALIGGLAYWAVGWALAYGEGYNGFIGTSNFFAVGMEYGNYASWFFQFVFAATAATIVSGSIAERCQFAAYFVYSVVITGLVYPPVSHWAWDGGNGEDNHGAGWLVNLGYGDFAGSGVVHLCGGMCALVATSLIGPRKGRFCSKGKPQDFPGHSVPLAGLGGFILLFGFLAFNGGSQASISHQGDSAAVARAIVNTILGACGAGLTVLFANKFLYGQKWSYLMTLNGALAGMVSMCAGCNVFMPWAAIVGGIFGGAAFLAAHTLMLKLKLDDPLDAVAVHGAGGIVGVILEPIFNYDKGIIYDISNPEVWEHLGVNLLGAVAIIAWSVTMAALVFGPMKYFDFYRIDAETEFKGNDLAKHGESAYPADAWVELQYNDSSSSGSTNKLSLMKGTSGAKAGGMNDPFHAMPASGKLFSGFANTFGVLGATPGEGDSGVEMRASKS